MPTSKKEVVTLNGWICSHSYELFLYFGMSIIYNLYIHIFCGSLTPQARLKDFFFSLETRQIPLVDASRLDAHLKKRSHTERMDVLPRRGVRECDALAEARTPSLGHLLQQRKVAVVGGELGLAERRTLAILLC